MVLVLSEVNYPTVETDSADPGVGSAASRGSATTSPATSILCRMAWSRSRWSWVVTSKDRRRPGWETWQAAWSMLAEVEPYLFAWSKPGATVSRSQPKRVAGGWACGQRPFCGRLAETGASAACCRWPMSQPQRRPSDRKTAPAWRRSSCRREWQHGTSSCPPSCSISRSMAAASARSRRNSWRPCQRRRSEHAIVVVCGDFNAGPIR